MNKNKGMIVYYNGKFLPESEVHISPNDRGFVFADGTYEVLRTYSGKLLFADEHLERLKYSLDQLKIKHPNLSEFKNIFHHLLDVNELNNDFGIIYIQVTRGVYKRMHAFPDEEVSPTVFIRAREFTPMTDKIKNGVKAITKEDFRWTRCDIKSISLLPNILAAELAKDHQAYEAIFYRNAVITEGSHTNVFGIKDSKIYTHPKSQYILAGISRDVVVDICKKSPYEMIEHGIRLDDFLQMDEIFLAGTSTEIMPVVQVDDKIISNHQPGKITVELQKYFDEFVYKSLR